LGQFDPWGDSPGTAREQPGVKVKIKGPEVSKGMLKLGHSIKTRGGDRGIRNNRERDGIDKVPIKKKRPQRHCRSHKGAGNKGNGHIRGGFKGREQTGFAPGGRATSLTKAVLNTLSTNWGGGRGAGKIGSAG